MAKKSAGILAYRLNKKSPEVLLVHPGGPFWQNKDLGAWSIPKGEFTDEEEPLQAAIREFEEELGKSIQGDFRPLSPVRQKSGKVVYAFAVESDVDVTNFHSNIFLLEWPPKSGRQMEVPEVDRAEWFDVAAAKLKINSYQGAFIDELIRKLYH
jgi:predicted NUDIX family NTP pyrophosphohydrolase